MTARARGEAARMAASDPRIAIIGNMNNVGFTIMRYFRDLGSDAWLLPFSNDGTGGLSHFKPQDDSWDIAKWEKYIRTLPAPNSTEAIIGHPPALRLPPSRRRLDAALEGHDVFIGSGIAPALFERLNRRLDAFFPYGVGIEFYGEHVFLARMRTSAVRRLLHRRVQALQEAGIRNSRCCLNAEMSVTRESFERMKRPFERIGLPAVYNREDLSNVRTPDWLRAALGRIEKSEISLFSAARLLWVRDPLIRNEDWASYSKNSDWLIQGLAEFVRKRSEARPLLTLVEYGPDVNATKRLIFELGVSDFVQWLPRMSRRELMLCLSASDAGVGEFYMQPGLLWGGTGWEVLASGKPLLQAFNFSAAEYKAAFGHAPPPLLDVKSAAQVSGHLEALYQDPQMGRAMGRTALGWFDEHGGIGLAKRWLETLAR
jgi:hypothetical protein